MEGIKINGKTVDKTDGVSFLPGFQAYISSGRFQEVLESVGALVLGTATADSMVYCKDQTSVLVVAALLVLEHILKVHLRLMVVQICRFQNKAPSCLNLCLPFINETGIFIF
jgi:hypothetical protein